MPLLQNNFKTEIQHLMHSRWTSKVKLASFGDISNKHYIYDQVAPKELDCLKQCIKVKKHRFLKSKQNIKSKLQNVMFDPLVLQLCNIFNINREVLQGDTEEPIPLQTPTLTKQNSSLKKINKKRRKFSKRQRLQQKPLNEIKYTNQQFDSPHNQKYDSPYNTNQFLVRKYPDDYDTQETMMTTQKYVPGSMLDMLLSEDQTPSNESQTMEELHKEIIEKDQKISELQLLLERHNIRY